MFSFGRLIPVKWNVPFSTAGVLVFSFRMCFHLRRYRPSLCAKTKVVLFNPNKNYNIMPRITFREDSTEFLDVVKEHKLLGQLVGSDLKTISITAHINLLIF